MDLLQYIGSIGGILGVFGYLIFLAYKNTVSQMQEDRKYMEDRLTKVLDDYNITCQNNQKVMVDYTHVMTELITYLRAKNGGK